MRLLLNFVLSSLLIFVLFSCKNKSATEAKMDFLSSNIDTSVSPAQDFFEYANGGWIKKNPIPQEESGWGVGNLVQEDIYSRLRKINEDAGAKNPAAGTVDQKIADFWSTGMDSAKADQQGLQPVQPLIKQIDSIQSITDLVNMTAYFHGLLSDVMFGDGVGQDAKNSELEAYQMGQGGLGMPNRDYYFNTDKQTETVKAAYQAYLVKIFEQLGNDSAAAKKSEQSVFNLETKLAKASRKLADLRDPYQELQ